MAERDKMIDVMEKYFATPLDRRTDTVWFTPTLEKEMRLLDVGNRDIAAMMMTIYWG